MTILRQEKQQYANSASLIAETVVPTANDTIYVEDLNREFDWIEGSTATHDGVYVIDQTSETANGRWIASKFASVYTGTATSDVIENGQSVIVDITVTDANPASANMISITNADTFPTNVFVISKMVVGMNTVRVVLENQSGTTQTAIPVEVTVLEFVKADAPVPVRLNTFTYVTGFVPSLATFETAIGFPLVDGIIDGDSIKFNNTGYAIPTNAFRDPSGAHRIVSVESQAISLGDRSFFRLLSSDIVSASFPLVTSMGVAAFGNASNLTSVIAPNLLSIGEGALQSANISSVNFPLCTSIGGWGFAACASLSSISLPSLTTLGQAAFSLCSALTSVSLPAYSGAIPTYTFLGCSALSSISFGSISTISSNAFAGCTALTSIGLPSAVTVEANAFDGCTALISIGLPSAVTVEANAFNNCTALISIDLSSVSNLGGSSFEDYVFGNIVGNSISLTIPTAEEFDGDVTYLQANNTVTLNLV